MAVAVTVAVTVAGAGEAAGMAILGGFMATLTEHMEEPPT